MTCINCSEGKVVAWEGLLVETGRRKWVKSFKEQTVTEEGSEGVKDRRDRGRNM